MSEALGGDTVTDATGAPVTVIAAVPLFPSLDGWEKVKSTGEKFRIVDGEVLRNGREEIVKEPWEAW